MDIPQSDVISLVYRLLPGFGSAWIFYGLTAHPPKSPFERTVQALIFTAITELIVAPLGWLLLWIGQKYGVLGPWNANSALVVSGVVAVFVGLLFAWLANTNKIHSKLPDAITTRTSYPSEWYAAFRRMKRYVYLHLTGGRRLYGWPMDWPDNSSSGHFVIVEPCWILDDNTRIPLYLVEQMVVSAADVVMVEFEKPNAVNLDTDEHKKGVELLVKLNREAQEQQQNVEPEQAPAGKDPLRNGRGSSPVLPQRPAAAAVDQDGS
jgi:hypothetical protein